jgi:hypothetical protein
MANTGLQSFSTTEADNATADGSINMAEGMAPSAVNNSIRALMARLAEWLEDNSGTVKVTTGSSNAYVLDSSQSWDTLDDGMTVAFTCHETNTGAATLNVNSMGAKSLKSIWTSDLPAGALVANKIYRASYDAGNDMWGLLMPNFASQSVMETGTALTDLVPVGRQHFHDGHPKGWVNANTSGSAQDSYNVSSVTDTSVGSATINWSTDFSTQDYCPVACTQLNTDSAFTDTGTQTAGAVLVRAVKHDATGLVDPSRFNVVAFGDHA